MAGKTTIDRAKEQGAKVPADRAAKAEATGDPIPVELDFNGETFAFVVDPDALDDADALEALQQNMPSLMFRALTGEHEGEFRDRLRDENGRLRVSDLAKFVMAGMEAMRLGKSSASPRS